MKFIQVFDLECVIFLSNIDKVSLLKEVMDGMQKVNEHAHKFTFSIVFHQLEAQLSQISTMEVRWSQNQSRI